MEYEIQNCSGTYYVKKVNHYFTAFNKSQKCHYDVDQAYIHIIHMWYIYNIFDGARMDHVRPFVDDTPVYMRNKNLPT